MVPRTAALDGIFFQCPPSGGGFTGVENQHSCALDSLNVLGSLGGYAGQALEVIQGGPFSGQ